MYFALGWPRVLACRPSDIVYLHLDAEHLVVVATDSVQLWTGGQHRVKLGRLVRDQESVQAEGLNRRACWLGSKRLLAVLVGRTARS